MDRNSNLYQSALDFLYGRIDYERITVPYREQEFKLDRMRELLRRLGNPHHRVPAVHIAGTKGKGSTAAILASVARQAGYRTGLFTSPHLACVEERIGIDGTDINPGEFARLLTEVREAVEGMDRADCDSEGATFFEIVTAVAFLYFVRNRVDLAVLEVGLGGRLDSTNICLPLVCVITSISYDHMRQLGNTLTAIAGEKAGIIKPEVPVVSGVVETEPRTVIEHVAGERNAPIWMRDRDFWFEYQTSADSPSGVPFLGPCATTPSTPEENSSQAVGSMDASRCGHAPHGIGPSSGGAIATRVAGWMTYHEPRGSKFTTLANLPITMRGRHQAANAATAIAAIHRLIDAGWAFSEQQIRAGLAVAHCPARVEIVSEAPMIVMDVAHNVASIQALLESIPPKRYRHRAIVFAASQDKDIAGMLDQIVTHFDTLIFTRFTKNARAADPNELANDAQKRKIASGLETPAILVCNTPDESWALARGMAGPDDLICVTGSFFLVAELSDRVRGHC